MVWYNVTGSYLYLVITTDFYTMYKKYNLFNVFGLCVPISQSQVKLYL